MRLKVVILGKILKTVNYLSPCLPKAINEAPSFKILHLRLVVFSYILLSKKKHSNHFTGRLYFLRRQKRAPLLQKAP